MVIKNSFKRFFGPKKKGIVSKPRIFGESVIVKDRSRIKSKLAYRGKAYVLVSYKADHAVESYRVLNPVTKKIPLRQHVIFLRQSYGHWKEKKEVDKNVEFEGAPVSMLKGEEDEDIDKERNSRILNSPQLVRSIGDAD